MSLTIREGNKVAKEVGMQFEEPYWPHELNAHVFRTGKMDENSRWIQHVFYLAESPADCIARKLAARKEE
jgi:hypothetical protein